MSLIPIEIRRENAVDMAAIRDLHRQAFNGPAESRLVDELRADGDVRLSLVAVQDGRIVGHVLFSALRIVPPDDGTALSALALAPLAVLPEWQQQGIGSALVRAGLDLCEADGHRAVIVLGHPEYYARFGFSAERAALLQSPYAGPCFLARELVPGALTGVTGRVEYAPAFARLEG